MNEDPEPISYSDVELDGSQAAYSVSLRIGLDIKAFLRFPLEMEKYMLRGAPAGINVPYEAVNEKIKFILAAKLYFEPR